MKKLMSTLAKLLGLVAAVSLVGAPVVAYAGLPLATAPIVGGVMIAVLDF